MRTAYIHNEPLHLTLFAAADCAHPGPCDDDVDYWVNTHDISTQLDAIGINAIRAHLREYGIPERGESLSDKSARAYALWIAACDIVEEARNRHPFLMHGY